MAQFFTDFGEYATASGVPEGWTETWYSETVSIVESVEATSGKLLRVTKSDSSRYALAWDDVGSVDDAEIYVRKLSTNDDTGRTHGGGIVRAGGSAGSESGYHGVRIMVDDLRLGRFSNGNFSELATANDILDGPVWWHLRLQASGTDIRAKGWLDGNSEPSDWSIELTDSTLTSGTVGCFAFFADTYQWDLLGVGTDGDPAPTEAVDTGVTGPLFRTPGGYLRTASGILRPAT